MKYRKKPVVIDAIQFEDTVDCLTKLSNMGLDPVRVNYASNPQTLAIHTLEGVMTAATGDYVIKGISNEFYPCKADIFEKTYEAVSKP